MVAELCRRAVRSGLWMFGSFRFPLKDARLLVFFSYAFLILQCQPRKGSLESSARELVGRALGPIGRGSWDARGWRVVASALVSRKNHHFGDTHWCAVKGWDRCVCVCVCFVFVDAGVALL